MLCAGWRLQALEWSKTRPAAGLPANALLAGLGLGIADEAVK